uniref:Uncharacterized protein n=1 Tax=Laticauda laticaudata TaxID=8630 RepID=A0A8C5WTI4_LATLA
MEAAHRPRLRSPICRAKYDPPEKREREREWTAFPVARPTLHSHTGTRSPKKKTWHPTDKTFSSSS